MNRKRNNRIDVARVIRGIDTFGGKSLRDGMMRLAAIGGEGNKMCVEGKKERIDGNSIVCRSDNETQGQRQSDEVMGIWAEMHERRDGGTVINNKLVMTNYVHNDSSRDFIS